MWRKYILPSMACVSFGLVSYAGNSEILNSEGKQAENSVQQTSDTEQRFIIKFKGENQLLHTNENILSPKRAEEHLLREAKANALLSAGAKQTKPLDIINGFSIEADSATLDTLKKHPDIAFIEPDPVRTFQAEVVPYGIQQIQADFLSDSGTGNMTVCVADTGYEISHDDLPSTANITGEVSNTLLRDVDLSVWYQDTYGHGSHMAGTITAIGGNGIGTSGVLPSGNINLHVVKMIHNPNWWPVYGSDMIAAVERCVQAGAKVINLSIAGPQNSQAEEQAMQAAYDAGALIVSASGKFGSSAYFYPASYDSVISVSAIDEAENPWQFNQVNDQVELVAAGVKVKSTTRNNGYGTWDGTSVATAFTSGGLALLWSHHPECTNKEIRNIAHQTAKDLGEEGRDDVFGFGTLQLKAASELIHEAGCDGIANEAPEIAGLPEISVSVGDEYSFTPTATDPDNDELMFIVNNLPAWMQFDVTTGQILGVANASVIGTYDNISISVSDGELSAELPPFSVIVVDAQFTDWADKGAPYGFTEWLPSIAAQLADFQQARDYKQDQHRFEQKRKLDPATGIEVDNGEAIEHVRTQDRTEQRLISVAVSAWENTNIEPSCDEWSPAKDTVNYGEEFQQTRSCQQQQQRSRIYSYQSIELESELDEQTVTITQQQMQTGTKRDWQPTDSTFTAWVNDGAGFEYSTWMPAISTQTSNFTQSRNYKQKQKRFEQKRERDSISGEPRNVGSPIPHTQTLDLNVSRTVAVAWSGWTNDGAGYGHEEWAPAASGYSCTTTFEQTRHYSQKQVGDYRYSVNSALITTRSVSHVISVPESRNTAGQLPNWVSHPPVYGTWYSEGEGFDYQAWSPVSNDQTSDYSQSRSYSQRFVRSVQAREIDTCTQNVRNVGAPTSEESIGPGTAYRTVTVAWSGWSKDGGRYGHSSWSPDAANYSCTVNVSQTRNFKQDYQGSYVHTVAGTHIHTRPVSKTESDSESRLTGGEQPNWVNIAPEYSAWQPSGGSYDYSGWTPSSSNQTSNFTQSRTYKQDYTRTKYNRQKDTCSGTIRTVSSESQSKTETETENKTITVSCSSWSPGGPGVYIGNWTPPASQYYCDESVNQTRSFTQNYVRTCSHSNGHSFVDSKTEQRTASRTVNGTKIRYETLPPEYTPWENDGPPYGHSSWTPAATTQTASFTQSRTYKQNQLRYRQERRKNLCNNTVENVGSPVKETRAITKTETRIVTVSWSNWVKDGLPYACSEYEPLASEKPLGLRFTQRAQCKQKFKRTRSYSSGESFPEGYVGSAQLSRSAVGTKVVAKWTDIGWRTEGASDNYSEVRAIYNSIQKTSVTIGGACTSKGQVVVTAKVFEEEEDCDYGENCRYYYFISLREAKCQ